MLKRSRSDGPRSAKLQLRATEAECLALRQAASLSGQTLTDFLRTTLLDAAAVTRVDPRPAKSEITRARWPRQVAASTLDWLAWDQVRRIGVNLNQMVKLCHSHRQPPPPDAYALVQQIHQLLQRRPG